MLLKVGELFDKNKTRYSEGCKFEINDTGANLYIYFNNPTNDEIESCKKGDITVKFLKMDSVIFFLAKIGTIPMLDCPYSIHLSRNLTKIEYPEQNKGLSLTIFLINASNGILEVMRVIGLGEDFSNNLIETIKEQGNEGINLSKYDEDLSNIYRKYSTNQLERMCRYYYRIRKE